ncbi:MAG: toprim domain-containing protein [Candidatus Kapabacteria bacterium]|nr:toprim domain-containing protein [Candidatus Kapabacteria bacterium]
MTNHLRQWGVGTDAESRTVWHYVNYYGDHVTSKGMLYGTDGKRDKRTPPRYAVRRSDGRIERLTKEDGYSTCLYGECFLRDGMSLIDYRSGEVHRYGKNTTVFLVESEKSAVLGSFMLPQFVWIATGGVSGLGNKNMALWKGRTVIVFFDADNAGNNGAKKAEATLLQAGGRVKRTVASEVFGSDIKDGYDIADYFVQRYSEYNEDTERLAIIEADLQSLVGAV